MADKSNISWTDASWNPTGGCTRVSDGCTRCYAETMAARFSGPGQPSEGLTINGRWTGKVVTYPNRLDIPLHWRKPRRIFVCSMSDLFHESVPSWFIYRVYGVFASCPQHTFQVLTKRPERRAAFLSDLGAKRRGWPLHNVWEGTSIENQETANERIPWLLKTPAAVRFVSCEPLLGRVNLEPWLFDCLCGQCWRHMRSGDTNVNDNDGAEECPSCNSSYLIDADQEDVKLDWCIVGGESGPKARPMNLDWARALRDQCRAAHIPFHFKQAGGLRPGTGETLDGEIIHEFPEAKND